MFIQMRPTKSSHCFEVKGKQVKFTSNFDSGNLRTVTQTGELQFTIQSSYDSYEMACSNKSFFHFRVDNYPMGQLILLKINSLALLQCIKPERRIYYRPCYSYNGHDYERVPQNHSSITNLNGSLNLQINFVIQKTSIYFAFALPYSYERYLNMVRDLPESNKQIYLKKQVLCYSKNLLLVYMITITSYDRKTDGYDQIGSVNNGVVLPEKHLDESRVYFDKPVILLSARVHPGQTPSSWAIQGIVKFLIGDSEQAKILRKTFQIVIVPMLNPDGVYEGMYRLDTQGHNLNRYYLISDNRQPSIYSMKHLIKHYNATKRLLFYIDIHGHPSFKGSFLYGNAIDDLAYQAETELFGRIMSLKCDTFQEKYCIFDRQQMTSKDRYDMYTKQGCARVYAFKTANILHSYTFQMGFHGCTRFSPSSNKTIETFCYSHQDYEIEGINILLTILEVCSLCQSGIDKRHLRKQIANQILTRQERFRKQDKHSRIKKKNVNEIIEKQYWASIKTKFFSNNTMLIPKFKNFSRDTRKKIMTRSSFKSNDHKNLESIEKSFNESPENKIRYKNKLQTESFGFINSSFTKKNIFDSPKKKTEIKKIIQMTSKHKRLFRMVRQDATLQVQIEKRMQKTFCGGDKPEQIKPHSQRSHKNIDFQEQIKKGGLEKHEESQFNDINFRKSSYESESSLQNKASYSVVSAQKIISPRIQELRDIFKSDGMKRSQVKVKTGKVFKKYSIFF